MRIAFSSLSVALVLCGLTAQHASASDRAEEFAKNKRALQQQLRSKQPSARGEALKKLGEYPLADAAKLLAGSFNDSSEEVRDTAYRTLIGLSDNREVCDTLLIMARKALGRRDDGQAVAPLLAVLLSSDLQTVTRDTGELLEKTVKKDGAPLVMTLADELGRHGDVIDVPPLAQLAKTKVFADHFAVRRATVQALSRIPKREAVTALVDMLTELHGEALADAVEHLIALTQQIFGMEAMAWQTWWATEKDTWEYPAKKIEAPYRSLALEGVSGYYYGMPLFAERMVFVLDTSGSMSGPRIVAAKRELVGAISGLDEHVHFGIVAFNGTVSLWQKQLVPATSQSKRAGCAYVNGQAARSHTASYDAIEAAFGFDTEAIYFISDGAPHGGKITAPVDIVTAITAANRARRISLYTIGIGVGLPGNPLDVFLKTLADQNHGTYRRVDE